MDEQRRTFLKKIGRVVILSGITGVTAHLLLKTEVENAKCDYDFICRNCRKNRTCKFPEAQAYQKEMNNKQHNHGQK